MRERELPTRPVNKHGWGGIAGNGERQAIGDDVAVACVKAGQDNRGRQMNKKGGGAANNGEGQAMGQ
jgi:hypothetical protein